jgi:hypothetical protein
MHILYTKFSVEFTSGPQDVTQCVGPNCHSATSCYKHVHPAHPLPSPNWMIGEFTEASIPVGKTMLSCGHVGCNCSTATHWIKWLLGPADMFRVRRKPGDSCPGITWLGGTKQDFGQRVRFHSSGTFPIHCTWLRHVFFAFLRPKFFSNLILKMIEDKSQ